MENPALQNAEMEWKVADQAAVEAHAMALFKTDPAAAVKYLTELTVSRMEELVGLYRELRTTLLTKYTGDGV